MKIFVVTLVWQDNDGDDGVTVELFKTEEKARKYMQQLIEDTKDLGYDAHSKSKNSYSAYEEGCYMGNHTNIILEEKEIKENTEVINIERKKLKRLLDIANNYFDDYCENFDEYVLNDNEIKEIEDEEEKEKAINLKETNDFLNEIAKILKNEEK